MDEQMREKFEAKYPMPSQCIWAGSGYAPTDYNAWNAQKHCARWEGWQACAAALSRPAAADGWIEWDGGRCPVQEHLVVDVKLRIGEPIEYIKAHDLSWQHTDSGSDIVAYRIAKADK